MSNHMLCMQNVASKQILAPYLEGTLKHVKQQRAAAKEMLEKQSTLQTLVSDKLAKATLEPSPRACMDVESLWLSSGSIVVGNEIGRGATGEVHDGMWGTKQVSLMARISSLSTSCTVANVWTE